MVPVISLILRYSITSLREFILPYSKTCGPDLFWLDDDDFNATFKCHFDQEWELLYVIVSTDIVLSVFCLWLPFTIILTKRSFSSKYFVANEEYELDYVNMGNRIH